MATTRMRDYGPRVMALLLFLTFSSQLYAADRERVYQEARAQIAAGQPDKAYDLLSRHELDWAGEDAYDYLLGVAALDSGHAGEAIFSLQRLVTRRPAFSGARMELARAYFDIGDNELARVEFEQILAESPPENVRAAAGEYMQAIERNARSYSASGQYFFELAAGYDSNAPAATDNDIFLNFVLNPNNLEQDSVFARAAFGADWSMPVGDDSQIVANIKLDHRLNAQAHYVDGSNAGAGVGWMTKRGDHTFSISANALSRHRVL